MPKCFLRACAKAVFIMVIFPIPASVPAFICGQFNGLLDDWQKAVRSTNTGLFLITEI